MSQLGVDSQLGVSVAVSTGEPDPEPVPSVLQQLGACNEHIIMDSAVRLIALAVAFLIYARSAEKIVSQLVVGLLEALAMLTSLAMAFSLYLTCAFGNANYAGKPEQCDECGGQNQGVRLLCGQAMSVPQNNKAQVLTHNVMTFFFTLFVFIFVLANQSPLQEKAHPNSSSASYMLYTLAVYYALTLVLAAFKLFDCRARDNLSNSLFILNLAMATSTLAVAFLSAQSVWAIFSNSSAIAEIDGKQYASVIITHTDLRLANIVAFFTLLLLTMSGISPLLIRYAHGCLGLEILVFLAFVLLTSQLSRSDSMLKSFLNENDPSEADQLDSLALYVCVVMYMVARMVGIFVRDSANEYLRTKISIRISISNTTTVSQQAAPSQPTLAVMPSQGLFAPTTSQSLPGLMMPSQGVCTMEPSQSLPGLMMPSQGACSMDQSQTDLESLQNLVRMLN